VPLESRTVRYIDNFSIGTRGATSAEYPFSRNYWTCICLLLCNDIFLLGFSISCLHFGNSVSDE